MIDTAINRNGESVNTVVYKIIDSIFSKTFQKPFHDSCVDCYDTVILNMYSVMYTLWHGVIIISLP